MRSSDHHTVASTFRPWVSNAHSANQLLASCCLCRLNAAGVAFGWGLKACFPAPSTHNGGTLYRAETSHFLPELYCSHSMLLLKEQRGAEDDLAALCRTSAAGRCFAGAVGRRGLQRSPQRAARVCFVSRRIPRRRGGRRSRCIFLIVITLRAVLTGDERPATPVPLLRCSAAAATAASVCPAMEQTIIDHGSAWHKGLLHEGRGEDWPCAPARRLLDGAPDHAVPRRVAVGVAVTDGDHLRVCGTTAVEVEGLNGR